MEGMKTIRRGRQISTRIDTCFPVTNQKSPNDNYFIQVSFCCHKIYFFFSGSWHTHTV